MIKFKQLVIKHIDKVLHFAGSYIIASILYALTGVFGLSVTFLLGFLIEMVDSAQEGNHFCWLDLLADVLGIGFGVAIYFV